MAGVLSPSLYGEVDDYEARMEARKKFEEREARVGRYYENFVKSEEGQVIIEDLMAKFHIMGPIAGTPHDLAFCEGERNVVLYILTRAKAQLGVKYE